MPVAYGQIMSAKNIHPGNRVAHVSLDREDGGALNGVAKDVVGDDEQQIVVVGAGSEDVAYDARELERVVNVPVLSRGPVLLYPRHLWRVLAAPFRRQHDRT
jgi:hypothetical protein